MLDFSGFWTAPLRALRPLPLNYLPQSPRRLQSKKGEVSNLLNPLRPLRPLRLIAPCGFLNFMRNIDFYIPLGYYIVYDSK